jgi:RimJ/RimL family protein N-acetyltransferase
LGRDPLAQLAALALYAQGHAKFRPRAGGHGQRGCGDAFAITLEQAPIGIIGVRMQPASHLQRGDGPNIGYWLGRRYWGHGYMTAALRGVVDHVFCMQPHDTI